MSLQDLQSWFMSLLSFEVRKVNALTDGERYSVEEDKALFFKGIGVCENLLESWFLSFLAFHLRADFASTDEERKSVEQELDSFLKGVVDEYNRESQNSIPPAA